MGIPLSVLIIEDSEDDAALMVRELNKAGYLVDFKRVDNADGLKRGLGARPWDLIISDFSMPRFSGTDALRLVRSIGSDTPFIFISGTMGEDTAVAALKNGAQDYLVKTNLKRLAPAVQRVLEEADERRQRWRLEEHVHQLRKFEAIGRLAGGVAHDFNNLLGVILGQSENLLEKPQDEKTVRGLEMIRESAMRGADLTRQLLAFGRKQVLQPKVLNINGILDDVEKLLRRVIGEDIELEFKTDANTGNVEADPTQLAQVLLNLAANARDAMPKGGRLTIATANVSLEGVHRGHPVVVKPGRYVQITVRDTGCGMDAETQARIFEPFFTTKERGKGTGLGLATVYGIVKQSGGYVWVYSEPGRGAAFKIYLPLVEAAAENPHSPAPSQELPRGSETILVLEDDAPLGEVTCEVLRNSGYTVLSANSPEEAVRLAGSHNGPIDFLLTDVIMPAMNGPDVAARLTEARPELKVLYVSGYADALLRDTAANPPEEGFAFLEKPYTRTALVRKVREILDSGKAAPASSKP